MRALTGGEEHVVVDADGTGDDDAEAEPGEDVRVVRLARHMHLPLVLHGVKRAATGKHRTPLGPGVGFFSRAFRVGRRVRQREDDRSLHSEFSTYYAIVGQVGNTSEIWRKHSLIEWQIYG